MKIFLFLDYCILVTEHYMYQIHQSSPNSSSFIFTYCLRLRLNPYVYLTLFVIFVKKVDNRSLFFIFNAHYIVCYIFYLYCCAKYFIFWNTLFSLLFFICQIYIYMEQNMCSLPLF